MAVFRRLLTVTADHNPKLTVAKGRKWPKVVRLKNQRRFIKVE